MRRAAALAVALVAGALLAAPPPTADAAPRSIIQDDAALLREGPVRRERTLDDMAALGADTVRIIVPWRDATRLWPALDAAVAGARAGGLDVLLTLTGTAAATPSPSAYRRFVAAAGARYPDVRAWSLWNEPNVPSWLSPVGAVRRYRALVRVGAAALTATGHGKDIILIGETAPVTTGTTGPPARRPIAPLAFVRAVLAAGPLPPAVSGWAHHAYAGAGTLDPGRPGRRAALGPARLDVLEAALRGARTRLPIWLTEGGFQTNPPDPFFGVPPAMQAAWMNELDWLASRRATVRSVAQYLVRDERARSSFQSGVRYADGRRKPSWDAYRAPLWITRRAAGGVAVWGRVRPPGGTLIALQRRAPGARHWRTIATLHGRTVERRVAAGLRGARFRLLWRDAAGTIQASRAAAA